MKGICGLHVPAIIGVGLICRQPESSSEPSSFGGPSLLERALGGQSGAARILSAPPGRIGRKGLEVLFKLKNRQTPRSECHFMHWLPQACSLSLDFTPFSTFLVFPTPFSSLLFPAYYSPKYLCSGMQYPAFYNFLKILIVSPILLQLLFFAGYIYGFVPNFCRDMLRHFSPCCTGGIYCLSSTGKTFLGKTRSIVLELLLKKRDK